MMDIKAELNNYGLKLDQYQILRKADGRPSCPNELLEKVVKHKQKNGLNGSEENLYGWLIMTLARIVLNNVKFQHQEETLRMECFSEMMTVINSVESNFDWSKGSKYYSYLFNSMYHAGIHVLEGSNKRNAIATAIDEKMHDEYLDCGCRVCPVQHTTSATSTRQYYTRLPEPEEEDDDADCGLILDER